MSSATKGQVHEEKSVQIPLMNQLANQVLQYNTKFMKNELNVSANTPLFQSTIAIAGGGSGALSALTATPGASSFLLEGIISYDRISYANFITSPSILQNGIFGTRSKVESIPTDFKFSSKLAAEYLAEASLHKSLEYTLSKTDSTNQDINNVYKYMSNCIGVGCASMLSSTPGTRKSNQQPHGHVCIMYPDGSKDFLSCIMYPSSSITIDDPLMIRKNQDDRLSCVVLLSILISMRKKLVCCINEGSIPDTQENNDALKHLNEIIGNAVSDLTKAAETTLTPVPHSMKYSDFSILNDNMDLINNKAQAILSGVKQANLLLPKVNITHQVNDDVKFIYNSFEDTVIPMDSLIFPGSFNPMHIGHVSLAYAALKIMMKKREQEYNAQKAQPTSTKEKNSIWDLAHSKHKNHKLPPPPPPAVLFEMSIANADKAPMDITQIEQRSRWILEEMTKHTIYEDTDSPKLHIPTWGVLLDSAPLFFQKVQLIEKLITPFHQSTTSNNKHYERKMTFVIGTDTLVRILDTKYYDDEKEKMLTALRDMKHRGVHFVVGGRSEQGKYEGDSPKFIDGSKEIAEQPQDVKDMFTLLKEEDFRVDLSSTEIRKQRDLE